MTPSLGDLKLNIGGKHFNRLSPKGRVIISIQEGLNGVNQIIMLTLTVPEFQYTVSGFQFSVFLRWWRRRSIPHLIATNSPHLRPSRSQKRIFFSQRLIR